MKKIQLAPLQRCSRLDSRTLSLGLHPSNISDMYGIISGTIAIVAGPCCYGKGRDKYGDVHLAGKDVAIEKKFCSWAAWWKGGWEEC